MRVLCLFLFGFCSFAASVQPGDRYFPLVRNGGGWSTTITMMSLESGPADFQIFFRAGDGLSKPWSPVMKAAVGLTVDRDLVSGTINAGQSFTIELNDRSSAMLQGYAQVLAPGKRIGGIARVRNRDLGIDWTIPLTPGLERRYLYPVDGLQMQLLLLSETFNAMVDLSFIDPSGAVVKTDEIQFANDQAPGQFFIDLAQRYPDLKDFTGTVECRVSFPQAGLYDDLVSTSIAIRTDTSAVLLSTSSASWN